MIKMNSPVLLKYTSLVGLGLFFFLVLLFKQSHVIPQVPSESDLMKRSYLRHEEEAISLSPPLTNDPPPSPPPPPPRTNLSHIMFVLVGSVGGWRIRRPFIEAWWRPGVTRGNLFLDVEPTKEFLPWPETSPPFRVSEDVKKLYPHLRKPVHMRIYRSLLETYRLKRDEGVRWYVMGDEDSLFFIDNIVDVLAKYDHNEYHYIGMHSETIRSNFDLVFEMAFGGGGFALSYPLVETVVTQMDECIERYPYIWAADRMLSACLADFGVDITKEKGFHQMDLRGDISGFLSSLPSSPLLSLHHFKSVEPLFSGMSRTDSAIHLMKAGNADQTRILQQSICHHRPKNWTFSVSWGYSTHLYENTFPRSHLIRPIQTFLPWTNGRPPHFMFNTRRNSRDPCQAPHWFFFESIDENSEYGVVTSYVRNFPRNLTACSFYSAEHVNKIQVISPRKPKKAGRIECCDVEYTDTDVANIRLRDCGKGEVIA